MELVSGIKLGSYQVLAQIGAGSMDEPGHALQQSCSQNFLRALRTTSSQTSIESDPQLLPRKRRRWNQPPPNAGH